MPLTEDDPRYGYDFAIDQMPAERGKSWRWGAASVEIVTLGHLARLYDPTKAVIGDKLNADTRQRLQQRRKVAHRT